MQNWDEFLKRNRNFRNDLFYLSGTNYETRDIDNKYNPGNSPEKFNPDLFHEFCIIKKKKIFKDHIGHHILYQKDCGIL